MAAPSFLEQRRDVLPPLTPGKRPRPPVLSPQIKIKPRSSLPLPCGPRSGGDAVLHPPPWTSIVLPWCALGASFVSSPRWECGWELVQSPWFASPRGSSLGWPPCPGALPPTWLGRGERPPCLPRPGEEGRSSLPRRARSAPTTAQQLGLLPEPPVRFCSPADGVGRAGEKAELPFFLVFAPPVVYARRTPSLGASFSLFPSP